MWCLVTLTRRWLLLTDRATFAEQMRHEPQGGGGEYLGSGGQVVSDALALPWPNTKSCVCRSGGDPHKDVAPIFDQHRRRITALLTVVGAWGVAHS